MMALLWASLALGVGWAFAADRYWLIEGTAEARTGQHVFSWQRLEVPEARVAEANAVSRGAVEPPFSAADQGSDASQSTGRWSQ